MGFAAGMQLGADALYKGADFGLRRRSEDRLKERHDWDLQMLREAEDRNVAAAGLLQVPEGPGMAPAASTLEQPVGAGPSGDGLRLPAAGAMNPGGLRMDARPAGFTAQATPSVAPRAQLGNPATLDDTPAAQARQRMALAKTLRNFDQFNEASAQYSTLQRNQRYNELRKRAEQGDPELLALVNQRSPNTTVIKGENGYEYISVGPDGTATKNSVSAYELGQIAVANAMMQDGLLEEGYKVAAAVNSGIAAALQQNFTNNAKATEQNNQATRYGNQDTNDANRLAETTRHNQAMEKLRGREVGVQEGRASQERNALQQKIDTIERATGKKLTEAEIKALGGLKIDEPGGLKFNKTDDGVVFTDQRGNPVGKLDPAMGLVPYGQDPRQDPRFVQNLERNGVKISVEQLSDGTPVWGYVSRDGRKWSNPEAAINPPIGQQDVQDLSALRGLLDTRRSQLVAAGRSGDPRSIQMLSQEVQGLQRTLAAAAQERFGSRADEYLKQ